MSYIKSLRTTLKEKNQELFNRLHEIEELAKSTLTYTVSKFPYYTPHDFKHSLNVEENLNWLVPDEKKTELNSYEIFFLIVSSWLHDWGMLGSAHENPEEIRENHHIRTEENFEKLHDKIRLSLNEGRITGRICRGHRKENLLDSQFDDLFFRSNIRIRTRFLSALLRIADECDVTENRVPEIIYYSLSPTGVSEKEFRSHLSIIGIGQPEPYKIQLSGVARDPKGVKVLQEVQKRIQNELNSVKTILARENIVLDYVELRVDTRGFINKPIEFVLDREKIVDLLIGKNLYHRFDAGIRELLQNSIDACRLRNSLEKRYTPRIIFAFNKERISIEDNGIGMSFDAASRYLSNIGASFFVSKEFEDLKAGKDIFDPISRFGIGILSCFLIASSVVIETLKENEDPCKFIIEDLAEGWRYEAGSRKAVGTKITLTLNEEGKLLSLEKVLEHYAKAVEFQIQLINEETGERKLLQPRWNCSMDEVVEVLQSSEGIQTPTFSRIIKTDGIEATYFFIERLNLYRGNYFLACHGLYVGNFSLCSCVSESFIVLVNCTKNLVDLAVSREKLVENKKHFDFIGALYDNFFTFLKEHARAHTRAKKLSDLSKCAHYAGMYKRFFTGGVITRPEEWKALQSFFLSAIYPVLDATRGLRLLSGRQIISQKNLNRIFDYSTEPNELQYHIESVETLIKEIIGPDDIVIFNVAPKLMFVDADAHLRPFEVFCKSKGLAYEHLDLAELLRRQKLSKTSTPFDEMLPGDSFFAKLPPRFRSSVIMIEPFVFEKYRERDIFGDLLLIQELFSFDNEIYESWKGLIRERMKHFGAKGPIRKLAQGKYAFDIEDPVIKFMLKKSDFVLSNKGIRKLVEGYFRYLILAFAHPSLFLEREERLGYLTTLEKTLLSLLGYDGEYKPLLERTGGMGKVLCYYPFREFV